MTDSTPTRVYRWSAVCGLITLLSFVLPRFIPNAEGGFAAGANAVLVMLMMLLLAFLCSIYAALITVKHYRLLPVGAKLAGLAPALLLGAGLAGLFVFLRF